jgi:glutamate/tyrosine decarboxylase-like PLP-dependent enzyme
MPRMEEDFSKNVGLVGHLHNLVREHPDFEVLGEPTLYLYRFRYVPNVMAERQDEPEVQKLLDRLNQEIVENVQRLGLTLVNTRVRGRMAIQMSICSRRTLAAEVDAVFETVAQWGRLLHKKLSVRHETTSDMEAQLCLNESHSSPMEV